MSRLEFRWSWVYQQLHVPKEVSYDPKNVKELVDDFRSRLIAKWATLDKKILDYLEEITTLRWQKDEIVCYVLWLSYLGPLSDPLTVPFQLFRNGEIVTLDMDRIIDNLVHELIHNLMIQNREITKPYFELVAKTKYKEEAPVTARHLIIHAIHTKVFERFMSPERLQREIAVTSKIPTYKKSWEIVQRETSDAILAEFRSYLGDR